MPETRIDPYIDLYWVTDSEEEALRDQANAAGFLTWLIDTHIIDWH